MSLAEVTSWPAAIAILATTAGSAWTSWLAYKASVRSHEQLKDSTVLTRATDTTHAARMGRLNRRTDDGTMDADQGRTGAAPEGGPA